MGFFKKLKKEAKRATKNVEKYGKEAVKTQLSLYGIQPGSSGVGGDVAEVISGGSFQSGTTKSEIAAGEAAQAKQQSIVDAADLKQKKVDDKRRVRTSRQALGRRSLLSGGGTELGTMRSKTLGGR